jgi:hypothetical protein
MKPLRTALGSAVLLALMIVTVNSSTHQASSPPPAPESPEYQLLTNQSMENYDAPYGQCYGANAQVATGWQRFWYGGPEPCWMDGRVFAHDVMNTGWVECMDADPEHCVSQALFSAEPYTAGIWQQVSGLSPGVGYGFHAAMLTIYQSSSPPTVDGKMFKQVGIDPTGGTDAQASTVVWSESSDRDSRWRINLFTSAFAQGNTVTVFIRVISPDDSGGWEPYLNQSFLDSAILARTGSVSATSPAETDETTFTVRWNNVVPVPDGQIRCYDAQYMDEVDGVWRDWITCDLKSPTINTQASFTGQPYHTYRFRARVWQLYPNGAHLPSPYRAEGDTRTHVGSYRTLLPLIRR